MAETDAIFLQLLAPLAVIILIVGVDDLWIYAAWIWFQLWGRRSWVGQTSVCREHSARPERRIAIFLPLWHEHEVILDMLANNIGCLRYSNYHIFAGVYPNDPLTREALAEAQRRWSNVRIVACPHEGPTSKADCLNWIYQRMLLYEEEHGGPRFDIVVIHDAEDVIHPDELRTISAHASRYDFIQIPVLPLPVSPLAFTNGIYCDEFAQAHTIDMPVRGAVGGFVPSAGVGTAYSRSSLDRLAETESNRVFDPACLTEDYENGFRLHALGARQIFLPLSRTSGTGPVATREYFPRTWRAALRQRTRWITGIALQTWERHGWSGGWQAYWWWHDRRGLIGTPAGALSSLVFLYALVTQAWTRVSIPPWLAVCLALTLPLQALRTGVHLACSSYWFGPLFGVLAPAREIFATWLNTIATFRAIAIYAHAKWRRRPLVWVKTEHAYPSRAALLDHRRLLGEILTGSLYITPADLEVALKSQPRRMRLGEWLVRLGKLTEDELYEALSIQSGHPLGREAIERVQPAAVRTIPANIAREWFVVPFEIRQGELHIAGPEPDVRMEFALQAYTSLKIRFHLVTPREFAELERQVSEG
jgi:adsorption protein B